MLNVEWWYDGEIKDKRKVWLFTSENPVEEIGNIRIHQDGRKFKYLKTVKELEK